MTNILDMIDSGQLDDDLDVVVEAIKVRRQVMQLRRMREVREGDTVVFNSTARPGYLEGTTAEVLRKNTKRLVVRLLDTASARYTAGAEVTTPMSIVDLVTGTHLCDTCGESLAEQSADGMAEVVRDGEHVVVHTGCMQAGEVPAA